MDRQTLTLEDSEQESRTLELEEKLKLKIDEKKVNRRSYVIFNKMKDLEKIQILETTIIELLEKLKAKDDDITVRKSICYGS